LETILKLKRLNETNAELAMREPEKFRAEATEALRARDGRIELQLMPYEILTVEG